MSDVRAQLIEAARAARQCAYAPYSGYRVGCAVYADGQIYRGANVENASYGLCICAERVACANAAMAGARDIAQIAVMTQSSPPAAPCGMCLQTIRELCMNPNELHIIVFNEDGEQNEYTLAQLSPHAFHKSQLTP